MILFVQLNTWKTCLHPSLFFLFFFFFKKPYSVIDRSWSFNKEISCSNLFHSIVLIILINVSLTGGQTLRWLPGTPPTCPCIIPSPWVWAEPVINRIWQRWLDTILIIMLYYIRFYDPIQFALKSCPSFWLWGKKLPSILKLKEINSSNNISEFGNKLSLVKLPDEHWDLIDSSLQPCR